MRKKNLSQKSIRELIFEICDLPRRSLRKEKLLEEVKRRKLNFAEICKYLVEKKESEKADG